jgi:hypothetical protein
MIGGFVAAEGSFIYTPPRRFAFVVSLGALDVDMCHLLRAYFGVGTVRHHPRRQPHFDDEAVFRVQRLRDLAVIIVPFMDAHLPPSHKAIQYRSWRRELMSYTSRHARTDRWG